MSAADNVTEGSIWLAFFKSWIRGDASAVVKDPDGEDRDSPRKQVAELIAAAEADIAAGVAGLSAKASGPTADRPNLGSGSRFLYGDDDLGKVIYWNGSAWTNVDGTPL